jgi:hypothetical protein
MLPPNSLLPIFARHPTAGGISLWVSAENRRKSGGMKKEAILSIPIPAKLQMSGRMGSGKAGHNFEYS